MRIRKHANIPLSPSLSTRTTLHPHVCELNRSPWDVMPFPLQSDGHSHPNPYQREDVEEEEVEEEEAVMGMGNGVSSIAAAAAAADGSGEREFSEEEREEKKKKKREERGVAAEREMIPSKGKTCNKEEDEGQSQLEACPKVGEKDEVRGRRGRKNQGRAFSSNSDYYYYYSGFGPLWGRKRGGNQLHGVDVPLIPSPSSPSSSPLPSSSDHDDHDHDHDHDHDRRMKRVRKRVKARSLKSLF